ncbi:MAG: peptide deformylase, partial [Candidatus Aminicenantes bacterium]|nr:peptide deformylase [Candidatus Aminicenantes bacterium]
TVKLVEKMRFTMYEASGVGLAAPQIGKSIRLAIVDITSGENQDEFMVLINPEIIESQGSESAEEGCLSIPGISVQVDRSTHIKIRAHDLQGKEIQKEYEGHKARVIQHEIDHLKGVLIIDHLSILKKQLAKKEIKKLKKNDQW